MKLPRIAVPRILFLAGLAATLVSSGCASASARGDEEGGVVSDYARSGAYVGLYGIQSYEDFHTSNNSVHPGNSDLGGGLKVGYRATPNLAVEVLAENVKGFRLSDGSADADLDLLNFGLMGKYYIMTERVQPYVVAGVGLARSHVRNFSYDNDGGFLRAGLGADVYITTNVALFGEANYNRMMGGVSDLHHIDLQFGLIFRF